MIDDRAERSMDRKKRDSRDIDICFRKNHETRPTFAAQFQCSLYHQRTFPRVRQREEVECGDEDQTQTHQPDFASGTSLFRSEFIEWHVGRTGGTDRPGTYFCVRSCCLSAVDPEGFVLAMNQ